MSFVFDYKLLLMILIYGIINLVVFRKTKLSIHKYIISFLFSFFIMIGNAIQYNESIDVLFNDRSPFMWKVLVILGYFLLIVVMFKYTKKLLSFILEEDDKKQLNKIIAFYKNHPFIISFILIFLAWLIYIIAFYPGVIYGDSRNQLLQYFNLPTRYLKYTVIRDPNVLMTAHNPVLHTLIIGWCFSLGRFLLNDNFGFFIYTLLQTTLLISVLSYSIKLAFKNNVKPLLIILLLLIYMFTPMFPFYAISIGKDTMYFIFYALIVLFLFDYVSSNNHFELSIKHLIILFIITMLMCLTRHNGVLILVCFIPLFFIFSKKNRLKLLITFSLIVLSVILINKVIIPGFGISDTSKGEALSIPFQQTARLSIHASEKVTEEDIKIINKVLDYDSLGDVYRRALADNVKKKYNNEASYSDLIKYFGVWFKLGLKEPVLYLDAAFNVDYGYFDPFISKWYIYSDEDDLSQYDINYHYNKLSGLRDTLVRFSSFAHETDFIGLLSNVGFNFWWIIILVSYIMEKKNYKYLIVLIPLFMTFVACMLGPANMHFRYALPNIFIIPSLTLLIIYKLKKE